MRDEVAKLRADNMWLLGEVGRAQGRVTLDSPRVRQLLQLCHPDRHNGSELSGQVTAWLLDAKRRLE